MKRFVSFFLALLTVFCVFSSVLAVSESFSYVTTAQTPTTRAKLKYSLKLGDGFKNSPTPPLVVKDTLIVASGMKIYKFNAETGKELASSKLISGLGYSTVSPAYYDGKIFVQLGTGKIQAFDYKTLKSLWVYTDPLGGQAISPITCDGGYIYTGFWSGETENANYVCLSTKDENPKKETEAKKATWTRKIKGGFYWAGSAVSGNFVVVGTDDGKGGSVSSSRILCLKKKSGKIVSSLNTKGDIRSSVVFDKKLEAFFVSSKVGYVYRFKMNSSSGKLSSLKAYKASGSVTSSPVLYNGRIYVGCQTGSGGEFAVIDASKMSKIYSCEMLGYSQSTALIATGYQDKVYAYMTYNEKPGGVTVFEDSAGQKTAKKTELFKPSSSQAQYCICSVTASEDGTLFYKNDSGSVFALEKGSSSVLSVLEMIKTLLSKLLSFFKR